MAVAVQLGMIGEAVFTEGSCVGASVGAICADRLQAENISTNKRLRDKNRAESRELCTENPFHAQEKPGQAAQPKRATHLKHS